MYGAEGTALLYQATSSYINHIDLFAPQKTDICASLSIMKCTRQGNAIPLKLENG